MANKTRIAPPATGNWKPETTSNPQQVTIFGFITPRAPFRISKVLSKERMQQGAKLLKQGNTRGAFEIMREARYKLENYERSITHKPEPTTPFRGQGANHKPATTTPFRGQGPNPATRNSQPSNSLPR